jgi:hypothetical protein
MREQGNDPMNVIWKRPDGYHGASPEDYRVVELGAHSSPRLWLHKQDKLHYPFRISGGWQDEDASKKLNLLVNLLPEKNEHWKDHLKKMYHDSNFEDGVHFWNDLTQWIETLKGKLKGDRWEVALMDDVMAEIDLRLLDHKQEFLQGIP